MDGPNSFSVALIPHLKLPVGNKCSRFTVGRSPSPTMSLRFGVRFQVYLRLSRLSKTLTKSPSREHDLTTIVLSGVGHSQRSGLFPFASRKSTNGDSSVNEIQLGSHFQANIPLVFGRLIRNQ